MTRRFSSIPDAVEAIRNGQVVIVVDDEDRENEGDLCMAAEKVTAEAICPRIACSEIFIPPIITICSRRVSASRGLFAWIVAIDPSWPVFMA